MGQRHCNKIHFPVFDRGDDVCVAQCLPASLPLSVCLSLRLGSTKFFEQLPDDNLGRDRLPSLFRLPPSVFPPVFAPRPLCPVLCDAMPPSR